MSVIYDTPPTREQLIEADNQNKAWICWSYLLCNGMQGTRTAEAKKSYKWFNDVYNLKKKMIEEGYLFKVDLHYY
jgi:hypothetical protein